MAYMEIPKRGRYRVRWTDAEGKPKASPRLKDKTSAEHYLSRISAETDATKKLDRNTVLSLLELIERYILNRQADERMVERHAINTRSTLRRLVEARGWKTILDVTAESAGGCKAGEHRLLKALVKFGAQIGQPADMRVLLLRGPKKLRKPEQPLLAPEEVAALLDRAEGWCASAGAMGHMLACYGHRGESLVKMRVGDVNFADGMVTMIVKGGDTICHPILDSTLARLRPLCEGRDLAAPLFLSHHPGHMPAGRPWNSGQEFAAWWAHSVGKYACPRAPGPYELKKFAITSMLSRGLDPETIASITGHREAKTVLVYARTNLRKQRAALAAILETAHAFHTPLLPNSNARL